MPIVHSPNSFCDLGQVRCGRENRNSEKLDDVPKVTLENNDRGQDLEASQFPQVQNLTGLIVKIKRHYIWGNAGLQEV